MIASNGIPTTLAKLALPGLLLALAACETTGEAPYAPDASMGMLIARDSCAACHQTGLNGDSPNEDATPFHEVASRPGMTEESLAAWLRDGHNYPAEMNLRLEPHQVDSLVAYMLRLRSGQPIS